MIGEENEFETIGTWSGHRKLRKGRKAHHFPESLGSWFLANKTKAALFATCLPLSAYTAAIRGAERLMSFCNRW